MKFTVKKHANNKFLIKVTKASYSADRAYEVFYDLYFKVAFRDVKRFLNMEEEELCTEYSFSLKADVETLEITLAILKDYRYYDTTELENIINYIKEGS